MRRQVKGAAVRRELLPGTSPELLKELHLLTRAGDLNADSLRKLKQVNHLAGLLEPAIEDVLSRFGSPLLVDCGAGKSYLGFVLYELFLGRRARASCWRSSRGPTWRAPAPERAGPAGLRPAALRGRAHRGRARAGARPPRHRAARLRHRHRRRPGAGHPPRRRPRGGGPLLPGGGGAPARRGAGARRAARAALRAPLAPARVRVAPHQRGAGAGAGGARATG